MVAGVSPETPCGLDDRGVGERVGAEHLGRGVRAVVEVDADLAALAGQGGDVVVGEDLAVGAQDDARARPGAAGAAHVDLDHGGQHVVGDLHDRVGVRRRDGRAAALGDDRRRGDRAVVRGGPDRRAADAGGAADEQARGDDGAARPLPRVRFGGAPRAGGRHRRALGGRAETERTGVVRGLARGLEAVRRPGGGRCGRLRGPVWLGCGSCPPCGDSLLMPLTLAGESVTFLRHRWAPSKKAAAVRRHLRGPRHRARPGRSGRAGGAGCPPRC